jgi:hypothetical protein
MGAKGVRRFKRTSVAVAKDGAVTYDVGYGKPPRATQFKKGTSGNPKGRPKTKQETWGSVITGVLNGDVEFSEGGRVKHAAALEVIARDQASRAVTGDVAAARMLLKLKRLAEANDGGVNDLTPFVILLEAGQEKL